ncbi:hypothetical protein DPX16_7122 [Anabarilius grahami]|uniref:Uncharacterized protein n=1 Tax=Anabarilius grahami TaxID=495550 RepID=A0A3N0XW88_ANAGA|nr:hypothetical protein DPX16_7122 [Anabarilius grahami]
MEAIPELPVYPDATMEVILELVASPDLTTKVTPELPASLVMAPEANPNLSVPLLQFHLHSCGGHLLLHGDFQPCLHWSGLRGWSRHWSGLKTAGVCSGIRSAEGQSPKTHKATLEDHYYKVV